MKGIFISLCGLDGVGKTTQVQKLKERLETDLNREVITLPGYKPRFFMNRLLDVAKKLECEVDELFGAEVVSYCLLCDLWKNTNEIIIPELEKGNFVVSERYWESSLIYAPLLGRNAVMIERCLSVFPTPELMFFLDIEPEVAHNRIFQRDKGNGECIAEKDSLEIMYKAREQYKNFAASNIRCKRIDVNGLSPNEVHEKIINHIYQKLNK